MFSDIWAGYKRADPEAPLSFSSQTPEEKELCNANRLSLSSKNILSVELVKLF